MSTRMLNHMHGDAEPDAGALGERAVDGDDPAEPVARRGAVAAPPR